MSGRPLVLRPADVQVGDRVLVNGSWWTVKRVGAFPSDRWCVTVGSDGDELHLWRDPDQALDVDRPGNRWPWEAA